jgi:tRNA dimethylallyltransferase
VGPTASGKSDVALQLAAQGGAELISVDSMQVYREMDIGTAKPSAAQREAVPHHLVDVADPGDDFTVAEFQRLGRSALDRLAGRPVVVAGGSGLHMRSVLDPLEFPPSDRAVRAAVDRLADEESRAELLAADPEAGTVIDLDNPRRVQRAVEILRLTGDTPSSRWHRPSALAVRSYEPLTPFVGVGLDPGDDLEARVRLRFEHMMAMGLLDEVWALRTRLGRNAAQGVGYKELIPVVDGECELAEGVEAAIRATVSLARRQRTFFRRDPRIRWIEWHDDPDTRSERVRDAVREGIAWIS